MQSPAICCCLTTRPELSWGATSNWVLQKKLEQSRRLMFISCCGLTTWVSKGHPPWHFQSSFICCAYSSSSHVPVQPRSANITGAYQFVGQHLWWELLANYFYKFTSCGLIERGIWLSIHKSYCVYVAKMQTLHAIGNSPWWTSGHLHLILFLVFPSRIGKLNCIQFFHSLFGGQLAMCSIYERLIDNKQ